MRSLCSEISKIRVTLCIQDKSFTCCDDSFSDGIAISTIARNICTLKFASFKADGYKSEYAVIANKVPYLLAVPAWHI